MAKKKAAHTPPADDTAGLVCPKCGSTKICGLMAAFWVRVTADGGLIGQFSDYSSDTEIGPERMCTECEHEFGAD